MSAVPRLSIGLPVYNGAGLISESIEALLGQSYEDFELIISDNASTDGTGDICRGYAKRDPRIRYIRQPQNIGLNPNHNFVVRQARGELFKMASHDDLYARDLLKRCIDALDEKPEAVLAHAREARIDKSGNVTEVLKYSVAVDAPQGTGPVPQHAVRRLGRLHLWRHADEGPAPDASAPQSPLRGPDHQHRTGPAGAVLHGS